MRWFKWQEEKRGVVEEKEENEQGATDGATNFFSNSNYIYKHN